MDLLSVASAPTDQLLRQALRLSFAVEGVAATLETLRRPSRAMLEDHGLELRADCSLTLQDVAEQMHLSLDEAESHARIAGLQVTQDVVAGICFRKAQTDRDEEAEDPEDPEDAEDPSEPRRARSTSSED